MGCGASASREKLLSLRISELEHDNQRMKACLEQAQSQIFYSNLEHEDDDRLRKSENRLRDDRHQKSLKCLQSQVEEAEKRAGVSTLDNLLVRGTTEDLVGKGKFGKVYRMISRTDALPRAVKELEMKEGDEDLFDQLTEEVQKMSIVTSQFFVNYHYSFIENEFFYIIMDFVDGTEWDKVVKRRGENRFSDMQLYKWAMQLACGLRHLHDDCKLVHQDLHNGNVMVTCYDEADDERTLERSSVKIIDLGMALFKMRKNLQHQVIEGDLHAEGENEWTRSEKFARGTEDEPVIKAQQVRVGNGSRRVTCNDVGPSLRATTFDWQPTLTNADSNPEMLGKIGPANHRKGSRAASYVMSPVNELQGFKAIRAPEEMGEPIEKDADSGAGGVEGEQTARFHRQKAVRFTGKVDMWALGILLTEAILLAPIEEWFADRGTMQSFGSRSELQEQKLCEVRATGSALAGIVEKLLQKDPSRRISAQGFVQVLELVLGKKSEEFEVEVTSQLTRIKRSEISKSLARLESEKRDESSNSYLAIDLEAPQIKSPKHEASESVT